MGLAPRQAVIRSGNLYIIAVRGPVTDDGELRSRLASTTQGRSAKPANPDGEPGDLWAQRQTAAARREARGEWREAERQLRMAPQRLGA